MILAAFQEHLKMIEAEEQEISMLPEITASSYESSDMEPPIVRQSEEDLASDFLFRLLHQPHVTRTKEPVEELEIGEVSAFIVPPDEDNDEMVQYAVIATEYGCIYLFTTLTDDGGVPDSSRGVRIDFDNDALRTMVVGLAAGDALFDGLPTPEFHYIASTAEMEFLLGNSIKGIESVAVKLS